MKRRIVVLLTVLGLVAAGLSTSVPNVWPVATVDAAVEDDAGGRGVLAYACGQDDGIDICVISHVLTTDEFDALHPEAGNGEERGARLMAFPSISLRVWADTTLSRRGHRMASSSCSCIRQRPGSRRQPMGACT